MGKTVKTVLFARWHVPSKSAENCLQSVPWNVNQFLKDDEIQPFGGFKYTLGICTPKLGGRFPI